MTQSRLGIHIANANFRNPTDFYRVKWQSAVVLDLNIEWAKDFRAHYPDAKILMRCYPSPSWYEQDPVVWARYVAQKANDYRYLGIEVTWANEMNLQNEGHPGGAYEGYNYPVRSVYEDILRWNLIVIDTLRELIPWARLHFPALSQGHSDDQNDAGYVGFEILRKAVEKCDVVDVHTYFHVDQPANSWDSPWFGRRYERVHNLFPDKPIYISEMGAVNWHMPGAAEQTRKWFGALPDYVEGAAPFIWDTDQANENWKLYDKKEMVQMFTTYNPQTPAAVGPVRDAPWVTVDPAPVPTGYYWKFIDGWFQMGAGMRNIYIVTFDGTNPAIVTAIVSNGGEMPRKTELKPNGQAIADWPMSRDSAFDPDVKAGPYSAGIVSSEPSDIARGMGLVVKDNHIQDCEYWLVFKRVQGVPTPSDPKVAAFQALNTKVAAKELCLLHTNNQAWIFKAYGMIRKLVAVPQSDEFEFAASGKTYIGQLFYETVAPYGGIVFCEKGQYDLAHTFWVAKP